MARHVFGDFVADWAFAATSVSGVSNLAQLAGGVTITCWSARTGGVQYTDLQNEVGALVDHVLTSDGTDGRAVGTIPRFSGPDGVYSLWAAAGGGPRLLLLSPDVAQLAADLAQVEADLATHSAATNPHAVNLDALTDVSTAGATNGQVLTFSGGSWAPSTIAGGANGVTTNTDQTITGTKDWRPDAVGDSAATVQGLVGHTGDLWVFRSQAGQKTGSFNDQGEVRSQSALVSTVAARFKGLTGQTANILEIADGSNATIASVDALGRVRAPNISVVPPFAFKGTLTTGAGTLRWYNDTGQPLLIRSVRISTGTAPTGASVIVDVNVNGATIFGTQANRPTIPAGQQAAISTGMSITAINNGQFVTVDIDQIGSTAAGADLVVQILAY